MKRHAIVAAAILLGALTGLGGPGCSKRPDGTPILERLSAGYVEGTLRLNPEWATNLGDHRFDGEVSDLSAAGFRARRDFNRAYLDSLALLDDVALPPQAAGDLAILRRRAEAQVFLLDEVAEHRWNPLVYNPGDGLYNLVARDHAPLAVRLAALASRLAKLPANLEAAKANLDNPPRVMTATAIDQNQGVINLILDGLQPYLDQAPEMKDELAPVRARAIAALDEYGRWLQTDLLPRSHGDFRLGADKWRRKLRYTLASDMDPADILAGAERDLAATREQMHQVALPLYREFFGGHRDDVPPADAVIRRVLSRLADEHPSNATILDQARADLADITRFVRERDLVGVPDEPLQVIAMPEHQRGVAIGYCDSPGPLEKGGTTFYAISPTPAAWSAERAETFYREYNDDMLADLTIHEAMPGHYLQIAHANAYRAATPLRAIFSSGTFVEGWATYAEQLMVESGYGGPRLQMQQLKMRLRLIINAIIDQKIHTQGMTEGEAMELMMVDGFQEEGEAAGKWVRACLTSTQLSTYYVGNLEINRIRQAYQAARGAAYTHREFHDKLLSYGSPPPSLVAAWLGVGFTN